MLNFLAHKTELQQAERQEWLSHEIHDGACQYVAAAQMLFGSFRQDHMKTMPGDWASFDMGLEFLSHANEELRRLVHGLRPLQLAVGDLPKAIECLVQDIRAAGGPDIELCHDIQPDQMPPRLELAAFRIVQESLANACRHSKTKKLLVGLTQDGASLCIEIQDWGVGFDPNAVPPGHFGLKSIRRRVELLQGTVTIASAAGDGTLITVELPLTE